MLSGDPKVTTLSRDFHPRFISAWLLCAFFYFVQYALRSAPGVMVPRSTSSSKARVSTRTFDLAQ